MRITVDLPDDIDQSRDPQRKALEALAIAGYRTGELSAFQARILLGFESRFQFDEFLKQRQIDDHAYSLADLEEDIETLRKLDLYPCNRRLK